MTFKVHTLYIDQRWRHNGGDIITNLNGMSSYTVDAATTSDEGIYECHRNNKRSDGKHAIFQLIVRGTEVKHVVET